MTARYVCSAITAGLLACGVATVVPQRAQAQDATILPAEGGPITLVGCFSRGGEHDKYVLANPMNPVVSVPEATCAPSDTGQMLELEDTHSFNFNDSLIGHWIEITGRLEKLKEDTDDLRELHVKSFREVPVVVPRAAETILIPAPPPAYEPPPPAPQAQATPAPPEEKPVATTGQLPKTASPLPLIGFIGLLSLAGGLGYRLVNRQRR